MENKRILGEIVDIKPSYKDCNILYVTMEQYRGTVGKFIHNPSFWIEYNNVLYYTICEYDMMFLEDFNDWCVGDKGFFNNIRPGKDEFEYLMKKEPIFYEVEFNRIEEFSNSFSKYEIDLIEPYRMKKNRNDKIDEIL